MKFPLKDKRFQLLLFAVIVVLVLEFLSIMGIDLPRPFGPILFGVFILGVGYNVLWKGIKSLFRLKFSSISLLMTIAVIAAFYLQEYPEAAVVIVLYVLSEKLEDIGIENSKSALDQLVSRMPATACVRPLNQQVPVHQIQPGTIISIKPGELIPLDGQVILGDSTVDESTITGEPIPKDKHIGNMLYAGTLNKNGYLEIETTKPASETTFSKIVRLTFEASAHKSQTQKFIQRFSAYYTPFIIILAIITFSIPVFVYHGDVNHWLLQAVTLLVIACPCALVISTPVAIYAAIGNATSKGILIKGGKYIEAIARIKAIALDKTRTLTFGTPVVSDVISFGDTKREELLACTAGAELFSEHPLAQAIVNASRQEGFEPHATKNFQSLIGKGAIANCLVCEDETIYVGKLDFIKEHHHSNREAEATIEQLSDEGKTSVVVSFGKGIAGIIGLSDKIKPDSIKAIDELQRMNIETIMLTGDNEKVARHVARKLNISNVYGSLLPEEKAEEIRKLLKKYKRVAMVGDGINDAPALALSTVGIAMGAAGSDTAIETANIALMNDRLSLLPFLIGLGRKTIQTIRINTVGAILVKLLFIALAVVGYSNLVLAIVADVGITIAVIIISLNLMNFGSNT
ncbi:MAG: cation-translocating P-type ATPase [Bacteroidia bacterium]|nr:cation-translocating P-type ATPase [Bacteroidia bacterium]